MTGEPVMNTALVRQEEPAGERPEDMAIVYRCRACLTVHGRR